jgi:hypothetical protein
VSVRFDFNLDNWESLGTYNVVASYGPTNKMIPIPQQDLPITTTSRLIGIYISCDRMRTTWNWAGFALERVFTGLSVGGDSDSIKSSHKLYLGQINLVSLDLPSGTSSIRFVVPRYFPSWQCSVWAYTGPIDDSVESIRSLTSQIWETLSTS